MVIRVVQEGEMPPGHLFEVVRLTRARTSETGTGLRGAFPAGGAHAAVCWCRGVGRGGIQGPLQTKTEREDVLAAAHGFPDRCRRGRRAIPYEGAPPTSQGSPRSARGPTCCARAGARYQKFIRSVEELSRNPIPSKYDSHYQYKINLHI